MLDDLELAARCESTEQQLAQTVALVAELSTSQDRMFDAFVGFLKIHARRIMELESQILVLTMRLNSRS